MKYKNLKFKFKYIIEKIINNKINILFGCEDYENIIFDKIYLGERIILSYEWDHEDDLCNIIFEFKKNTYYIKHDGSFLLLYNFFDTNIFELYEYKRLYTDTDLELCEYKRLYTDTELELCEYIIKLYEFFKLNEEIEKELNKVKTTTQRKRVKI